MQNQDVSLPFTEHLNPVPKTPKTILVTFNTKFILPQADRACMWSRCSQMGMQKELSHLCCSSSQGAPLSRVSTDYGIYSCTTHTGVTFRKGCGEVWSLTYEGTGLGAGHGTLRSGRTLPYSQEILSQCLHTFLPMAGREFLDVSHKQDVSDPYGFSILVCVHGDFAVEHKQQQLYFCPSHKQEEATAFPFVTEYCHGFMEENKYRFHLLKNIMILHFPSSSFIQFLSDTGAHLFISHLCLQSLANSHIRFLTPRIMVPGPGCFSLLQQHTAPVKLLSLPCSWGFLLCESTVCNCSE